MPTVNELVQNLNWLPSIQDPALRNRAAEIWLSTPAKGNRRGANGCNEARRKAIFADPAIAAYRTAQDIEARERDRLANIKAEDRRLADEQKHQRRAEFLASVGVSEHLASDVIFPPAEAYERALRRPVIATFCEGEALKVLIRKALERGFDLVVSKRGYLYDFESFEVDYADYLTELEGEDDCAVAPDEDDEVYYLAHTKNVWVVYAGCDERA